MVKLERHVATSLCWCGSDFTGPPAGDHMANGRVERAVREVQRQLRDVHIADDSPLFSWRLRFAAQVMDKNENW